MNTQTPRLPSGKPKAPVYVLGVALALFTVSVVFFGVPQVRLAVQMGKADRARIQVTSVSQACAHWLEEQGSLPADLSSQFVRQLAGESSPTGKRYLAVSPAWTNALGQLIDPWGGPLTLVRSESLGLSIRSSGPNRLAGDGDDLIVHGARTPRERGP